MKNLKKILLVLCICTLLVAGCVIATSATDEYTGTLEEYEALVAKAESATNADAKYAAVIAMSEYLANTPVDPSTEGYGAVVDRADAAIVAAAEKLLAQIDANIETTLKTASNKVAINKLNRVLVTCELLGDKASLAEVEASLETLVEAHQRAVEKNLNDLENSNSIGDYDLPIYVEFDAESLNASPINKAGYVGPFDFNPKATDNELGIGQEANGNKYAYSSYSKTDQTDKNTYFQLPLSKYSYENGYVFEFDFTTLDAIPEKGVNIEAGGFDMTDGRGFPNYFLSIDPDGSLVVGRAPNSEYGSPKTVLPGAIVPGQWIHVAIIFNKPDFTYTLVVEGEVLATYTATYKGNSFDLSKGVIRFGAASESGSLAVDNFVLYSGNNYRNPNKFDSMNDDEKFVYYSNYLVADRDVNSKNVAYDMATGLLSKYWIYTDVELKTGDYTDYAKADPALMAAVDNYLDFDFEELLAVVKLNNLEEYANMVLALESKERTIANIETRKQSVLDIKVFLEKYDGLINTDLDSDGDGQTDYAAYNSILYQIEKEITYDSSAKLFIRYMNRFQTAPIPKTMQKYYERANELVLGGTLDLDVINNPDHEDREDLKDFVEAYEVYLASYDLLDAALKAENSAKIVNCMSFINGFTTEDEWMENYDLMNKYLDLVKDTVFITDENGGHLYDENYAGITEAVEFFNTTYWFFYDVRQERHIEYISDMLDLIFSTEAYIEKMGMVSMIDRYIASNELNYEDDRIVSLVNALETTRSELQVREEDYAKILVQNAVYFVNAVEDLRTAKTYSEQKKLFEKASEYYFNIDITVEGAANAVRIYDEYKIELTLIAESSVGFLEAYEYYTTCEDPAQRYAALVDCYYNAQFAEMSYYGVSEAMEAFEAEYNAYMDYVEEVNADVVAAGNAVGSLRTKCGVTPIIAIIIKKIYGE